MSRKTRAALRAKPAGKEHQIQFKTGRRWAVADMESAKRVLSGLGQIQASWKEASAVLGISEATLHRLFKRWPEVKDAFDSAKEVGKVGLRRTQFDLSKRNATMAIFLGMNILGQKDYRNTNLSGEVKHSHEHSIVAMMLKEIDEEHQRGGGAPIIEHRKDEGEAA